MKVSSLLKIGFVGSLCVMSCKQPLVEVEKNFISSGLFYKDATDADAAIIGAYAIANINNFYNQLIELHTDYAVGRGSWAPGSIFTQVLDQAFVARVRDFAWNPYYSMINRCNTVLAYVPAINMDATQKKTILAEARFLRAFGYFDLVRGFGPVPLRTSAITGLAEIGAKRAPESDIYNLIIEDLKVAETDLPNSVGTNTRRASKWAAKLVLAQVYLTLERWAEAAAKSDEIIAGGQYKLVPVAQPDDFYKLFAVNTSTEDIMSNHFSSALQDEYILTIHLPNIPAYNSASTGNYTTLPLTNKVIGPEWDNADLRKSFNLYTNYRNAGGTTVNLPAATPVLFKKYIAASNGIRSNSRVRLRYAEAFLIYAEAKAMADATPSALALERLNIIRRRGYGKDFNVPSTVDYPTGMDKTKFRETVLKERLYEFLLEQRRWWDLKRIGKAKEFIEAATGKAFNQYRLLFPIPEEEINNNPELSQQDQNPGY